MELKQIKELMATMGRTGITRVAIKKGDFELELEHEGSFQLLPVSERGGYSDGHLTAEEKAFHRANDAFAKGGSATTAPPVSAHPPVKEKKGLFVKAPMVGTFYHSPAPDEPPFVKVGDRVDKDTVVCIIEAMKVMNEVKAGVAGIVTEVMVENSHPVEFGTPLFCVE